MDKSFYFYLVNEIKVRIKTSVLLWAYYGVMASIFISTIPLALFFQQPILYQTLPSKILFIFLLFLPLTFDIFSREYQLNMIDYFTMNSVKFKTIYKTRIISNAFLMVIPILLGFSSIFLFQLLSFNLPSILQILVYLLIISLSFYLWFSIAIIILSITELKYSTNLSCVLIYFVIITCLIGCFSLLNELGKNLSSIPSVILGLTLFKNPAVSLLTTLIGCVMTQIFVLLLLTKIVHFYANKTEILGQKESRKIQYSSNYSIVEGLKSIKDLPLRFLMPILSFMPYLLLYSITTDPLQRVEGLLVVFSFHFLIILIYVLVLKFPLITVEKEFNMEELILSRISSTHYFLEKVKQLLVWILSPLILPGYMILILTRPFFFMMVGRHPFLNCLIQFGILLLIRVLYFVSILIFIWRLLPTKNLLQSTLLSIFGLEILGIFLFLLLTPPLNSPPLLIILMIAPPAFSPLLSSTSLYYYAITPNIFERFEILMPIALTIAFFFGSLLLIKSDIRFD